MKVVRPSRLAFQVYNEVIYDLLEKSSTPLDLREDVNGVAVVQARRIKVESAEAIMGANFGGKIRISLAGRVSSAAPLRC